MASKLFLSYSHKNRKLAHRLREALEQFGFSVFLAHDDIQVSKRWRKEILKNLKACAVFVPILTKEFIESDWTDQETGYALSQGARIVPVKVGIDPYGFIGEFQATTLKKGALAETCWKIMASLSNDDRLADDAREGAIDAFLRSGTFVDAQFNLPRLVKLGPFSQAQLAKLIEGSSRNQNIHGCYKARPLMQELLDQSRGRVPRRVIAKYRMAVQSWDQRGQGDLRLTRRSRRARLSGEAEAQRGNSG